MIENTLSQLGLNETEVKVYLTMLPLGTVPASVVGTRAGVPRSTAKYTCQQLLRKGLVTRENKNNITFYTAKNPDMLSKFLEKEKQSLVTKEQNLLQILENLKALYQAKSVLPKVTVFEGAENLITMFNDVLKEKKPLYAVLRLDDDKNIPPLLGKYLYQTYLPERKRLFFPAWSLFNDNEATRAYRNEDHETNRITLLVPEKDFPFDICFHIYGDKIAFYSYKPDDLMGVIIQNAYIHKLQFSLFKMAWNFARQLPENANYRKVSLD